MERLSALTALLGNKSKSWKHRSVTVNIYKRRLQQPHFQRNIYREMKEQITSQIKTIQSQKKKKKENSGREGQETFVYFI